MEDKEIQDFLKFLKIANETCKEKGKHYEFTCPICGCKAIAIKNTYNGHLRAKCEGCNMLIIQ